MRNKTFILGLSAVTLFFAVSASSASTGEQLAQRLRAQGLSPELVVLVVAMLPIVELRGAVPIGNNLFHLPLWKTVILSIGGNILPIVFILLLFERAVLILSRIPLFKRFFTWLFRRTRRKSGLIERFKFWGLVVFVGIPLPVTGAWTGSVAAVLLGMSYGQALLGILCGVVVAAGIVIVLSLLGWLGAVIAGLGLAFILLFQLRNERKQKLDRAEG